MYWKSGIYNLLYKLFEYSVDVENSCCAVFAVYSLQRDTSVCENSQVQES